jgi:hypothetical protein
MNLTAPKATILAAIIAVIGIALGAFLNPLGQKLINQPLPTANPTTLAIEQIPQQVFAYAGNNNPDGGWSAFWLGYDDKSIPIYRLDYSLPTDKNGFVGLAFQFSKGQNLSDYHAIESTIIFTEPLDEINLYIKDISNNLKTIRVAGNGAAQMNVRYEFTNFPDINFNAVQEIGIVASTDFSTGSHQVRIKNVRFVK